MKLDLNDSPAPWHGLATNPALPTDERLACALKALDLYEAAFAAAEDLGWQKAVAALRDEAARVAGGDYRMLFKLAADFLESTGGQP
jgi:hypothetical protein